MRLKLIISAIAMIVVLVACSTDTNSLVNDPRFNSGREYGTGKPIQPKTFRFGEHLFVLGHSGEASTLGLFKGKKELVFLTSPDGIFDSVAKAVVNADDLSDYLIYEKFEDGWAIDTLVSVAPDSFKHHTGGFMVETIP